MHGIDQTSLLQGAALGTAALPPDSPKFRNVSGKSQTITFSLPRSASAWARRHGERRPRARQQAAVCDIYQGRLDRAKELYGNDLFTTRDYREILSRKDIDAVVISTPDHLHAALAITAMEAGKDVYVQKPMVQKWEDGLRVVEAARKTGRVIQVGSQRVSSVVYKKAREVLKSGAIGELNMVEAWWDRNSAIGAWQYSIPPDATPETIDWDRFLGAAPRHAFDPIRLFRWRNYQDTAPASPAISSSPLLRLSLRHRRIGRRLASGGLRFWKDAVTCPMSCSDSTTTRRRPPTAFNLALRVNFVNGGGGSIQVHR